MPEPKRRRKQPDAIPAVNPQVTNWVRARQWAVVHRGELSYPVAVSVSMGADGVPRCTGLVVGMQAPHDVGDGHHVRRWFLGDAAGGPPVEITSASLRDNCHIPELLRAVQGAVQGLRSNLDELTRERFVTAAQLAVGVGPGYDPARCTICGIEGREAHAEADRGHEYGEFELAGFTADGQEVYKLPPPTFGGTLADDGRPLLDRLYPGIMPDLPPEARSAPRQAKPRAFYELVAREYVRALEVASEAPTTELVRRLSLMKELRKELKLGDGQQIPKVTVRRWVNKARKMDPPLLGPAPPGRAGR